ncbi:MAG: hypothetical protein OQL17_02285, partial [Sedimenticola sp.]|nr:hypothetical protein [Sedimenticola sp.]
MIKRTLIISLVIALLAGVGLALLLGLTLTGTGLGPLIAVAVASVVVTLLLVYVLHIKPIHKEIGFMRRLVEAKGHLNAQEEQQLATLGQGLAGPVFKQVGDTIQQFYGCSIGVVGRSGKIAIAGAEVSYAADVLKKRIDDQVDHIQKITEATGNISSNIEQAVTNSDTLKELSRQTRRASYIGQEAIGEAAEQMRNTGQHAQQAAELIAKLEDRAGQISQITKVISEIADQTNL